MRAAVVALFLAAAAAPAFADAPSFRFPSIDGGSYSTEEWRGKPVLVVNTASLCGFAGQYENLQTLSDRYQGRAVVLAVPSDDFAQELASEAEVKEFCEVNSISPGNLNGPTLLPTNKNLFLLWGTPERLARTIADLT